MTAGIRYSTGPFTMVTTYDQVYGAGKVQNATGTVHVSNTSKGSPKAWILGAIYDLKLAKLAAAYGQTIGGAFYGQSAGLGTQYAMPLETVTRGAGVLFDQALRTEQYLLGVTVALTEVDRIALSWQALRPVTESAHSGPSGTQSIISVMYTYDFSRRTNLYIWGSYGENFQMVKTARSSILGLGMRHQF